MYHKTDDCSRYHLPYCGGESCQFGSTAGAQKTQVSDALTGERMMLDSSGLHCIVTSDKDEDCCITES